MNEVLNSLIPLLYLVFGLVAFFVFLYVFPMNLWFNCIFSGIWISPNYLVALRIKKVPPRIIIECAITAKHAKLKFTLNQLEYHYLAGGHVPSVIKAMIAAKNNDAELSFEQAARIDLGGRDVYELVQVSKKTRNEQLTCIVDTKGKSIKTLISLNVYTEFKDFSFDNYDR